MTTRAVLIALAALLFTACKSSEPRNERAPDSSSVAVQRAPAVTEIEGVDLSIVPPEQRNDALRILNETFCYCGCPRSLASCLANRAECSCVKCSERMTSFILSEYKSGTETEDVEAQLLEGFAEGYNAKAQTFDAKDQPVKGAETAPYTVVEFADFRCPHCAAASEELAALAKKRSDVKIVYYYYPLGGVNAEMSVSCRLILRTRAPRRWITSRTSGGRLWMVFRRIRSAMLTSSRLSSVTFSLLPSLNTSR